MPHKRPTEREYNFPADRPNTKNLQQRIIRRRGASLLPLPAPEVSRLCAWAIWLEDQLVLHRLDLILCEKEEPNALPKVGQLLRDKKNDGTQLFKVTEVVERPKPWDGFMMLEWEGVDSATGNIGRRAQVFACKDFDKRWEVVDEKR